MLERLRIEGLALVERADLALGAGLNVITGETGAGKSLLVESVNLLVGERADSSAVRAGEKAAVVEGEFRLEGESARRAAALLEEWNLSLDGDTLIVRREVQSEGRSRATVNQSAVTQSALKRLGVILADLHGQHEHQSLLGPEAGIETLDRLGRLEPERASYRESLSRRREAVASLADLERRLAAFGSTREWMSDAARELDEARLREGEEEELAREAARLSHADRLRELLAGALAHLSEGDDAALDRLAAAAHAIEQAASLDPTLRDHLPALDEARIAAGEAARALAEYSSGLEADPAALEEIESRRDWIARLTRKHRRGVTELIAWREELRAELAMGEDAAEVLEKARARVRETTRACEESGERLSKARRAAAREWSTRLTRELKPLGMPHARVAFEVIAASADGERFLATGLDQVQILFTANPGESPRPLRRIASGGELSRVMLALKAALEREDPVDVLIFDEVDSGIGGAVAQAVGERLRRLARHRQVLCVTHLPMIAALASHHLRVTKHVAAGRTVVRIDGLESDARIEELARMLAGDLASGTTRRQARELLEAASSAR
jgi:DNA repair protein RecN (Recombination protein N)